MVDEDEARPQQLTTAITQDNQSRTGGFCCSKVLLAEYPCWINEKMQELLSMVLHALALYPQFQNKSEDNLRGTG